MEQMKYLTLGEVTKAVPFEVSTQTVFRWITSGCRGVKLESRRFGRRIVVTHDALDKFSRELAEAWETGAAHNEREDTLKPSRQRSAQARQAAIDRAEKNLKSKGMAV